MKTVTVVVLLLAGAACASRMPATGPMTGATSPEAALSQFLAAAKAKDLQAMSSVWGTSKGSVRETLPREEMEKRQVMMMALLCQDEARVTGSTPGIDGRRILRVELTRGAKRLMRNATTISSQDRWYVEDFQLDGELQLFCR